MAKLKHSKYRNTAFLFELLTRQITSDIISNKKSIAEKILKEHFNIKNQLGKEYKLYSMLLSEKYKSEYRADKFIDTVLDARSRLNENQLRKEKYELIKKLKENFDIPTFLGHPISNYKILASVYNVFESYVSDEYTNADSFNSRVTLVENIMVTKTIKKPEDKSDLALQSLKEESADLRALSYKILVEKFNDKYSNLNESQKKILSAYISNLTDNKKLKSFLVKEIKSLVAKLTELNKQIKDEITNIKLNETINQLKKIESHSINKINDHHLTAVLMSHELIKELETKIGELEND